MYMINLHPLFTLQVHPYPECLEELRPRYKSAAAERRTWGREWELFHCSIVYTVTGAVQCTRSNSAPRNCSVRQDWRERDSVTRCDTCAGTWRTTGRHSDDISARLIESDALEWQPAVVELRDGSAAPLSRPRLTAAVTLLHALRRRRGFKVLELAVDWPCRLASTPPPPRRRAAAVPRSPCRIRRRSRTGQRSSRRNAVTSVIDEIFIH